MTVMLIYLIIIIGQISLHSFNQIYINKYCLLYLGNRNITIIR